MCNDDILRLLADQRGCTVAEMATHFRVTETAIRNRLIRLAVTQSVTRKRSNETKGKRGRPTYLYYITSQGTARWRRRQDEGTAADPGHGAGDGHQLRLQRSCEQSWGVGDQRHAASEAGRLRGQDMP